MNCTLNVNTWRSGDVKNNELRISEIYPNPLTSLGYFQVESDHNSYLLIVITDYTGKVISSIISTIDTGSCIIMNAFSPLLREFSLLKSQIRK